MDGWMEWSGECARTYQNPMTPRSIHPHTHTHTHDTNDARTGTRPSAPRVCTSRRELFTTTRFRSSGPVNAQVKACVTPVGFWHVAT